MMGDKKKGGMALVLDLSSKGKGKDEADDSEESGDEDMTASTKREAAQAVLDAVAAKDVAALDDALSTHYDLCASGGGSEEGDE